MWGDNGRQGEKRLREGRRTIQQRETRREQWETRPRERGDTIQHRHTCGETMRDNGRQWETRPREGPGFRLLLLLPLLRPPPPHTQLTHTQLPHAQLVHTQLVHTQLTHTELPHTHNLSTHNLLTHNFLTHTQLTHTHTRNLLTHTTCSHTTCPHTIYSHTHNFLTHNLSTHNLMTHNFLTHTTSSHTPYSHTHTTCHTHTTYSHTQLVHTQLTNTQLRHTHTTYSHTTCPHTHTTYSHTTYSHTTCSHTTYPHTTYSRTHNLLTHNLLTQLVHTRLTHTHTQLAHTQLSHRHTQLGTWRHRPSLCVAGAALGEIDLHFALGWLWWRAWVWQSPRQLAWQAWRLVTSTFTLRGRCGTWRHGPSLCMAGVALTALGWLWWRAWVWRAPGLFAWQAWHLVTSTFTWRQGKTRPREGGQTIQHRHTCGETMGDKTSGRRTHHPTQAHMWGDNGRQGETRPRDGGHTIQHQGGHLKKALRTRNSTLFAEKLSSSTGTEPRNNRKHIVWYLLVNYIQHISPSYSHQNSLYPHQNVFVTKGSCCRSFS